MKIIDPSVVLLEESDPLKKIELAARTCYKSEAAITDESAVKMFDRLAQSSHTAMMEHATFVFEVTGLPDLFDRCKANKHLNTTVNLEMNRWLVSGNLRAINESGIADLMACLAETGGYGGRLAYLPFDSSKVDNEITLVDFENLPNKSCDEIAAHRYTTMRFVTDRGVTHEMVRHRLFSFAQESTRYVNYSKDQNGGGDLKFIRPAAWYNWEDARRHQFITAMCQAEDNYNAMTAAGATAQEARAVLPNAIKTEIVVTGNEAEWTHFFKLRSFGTTGAPHPDMKVVADEAVKLYVKHYK